MKNVDDLTCVQRAKNGDIQAFAAIVSDYKEMVFTIVMKMVQNREDAEDITQEVFIKVFRSLEKFKEEAEFSTWLYRIAYNATLSELRKKKLFFTSFEDDLISENKLFTDDKEVDEKEIKLQYLEVALKKLSPDEIFLVTLHYLDDKSIEEISKISNLSISNVKVKLHRIRKKLSLEISKLMQDE
ncbi:MAG: sigma-70 family RNA polymerase sigma factor [Prevotellaceae bacterium]|nr:sigma-70 family RNA polymerase sigma factor [Prevotellaceae bacterium]